MHIKNTNIIYQEHKLADLEEVLFLGHGDYSEKYFKPLHIVSKKTWNHDNISVTLFVLAASHATIIKTPNFTMVQVLACLSPSADSAFKLLNHRKMTDDSFGFWAPTNKSFSSEIWKKQCSEGKKLYNSFKKLIEISFDFPGDQAETSVSLVYEKSNLTINSFHSYPNEKHAVISELKINL